jgi:hypothetical protein
VVVAPDATASGVPTDGRAPAGSGLGGPVVRYGPTLLQGRGAPEDSWTILARQQHEWYVRMAGRDGRAARRPWGEPGDDPAQRLPAFFREENLSQHRHLLRVLADVTGGTWRAAHPGDAPAALPEAVRAGVVRSEHERWCELRESLGWRPPDRPPAPAASPEQRRAAALAAERERRNPSLVDWTTGQPRPSRGRAAGPEPYPPAVAESVRQGVRDWNHSLFDRIWARVFAWGITLDLPAAATPLPAEDAGSLGPGTGPRYRRRGEVRATRLTRPTAWRTQTGETLRAAPGDWWVVGEDGSRRTVAGNEFPRLYEHVAGDRYRRVGTVHARRVTSEEIVTTLEGEARALPGMWVITDATGDRWPVPDEVFRDGYEPAPE